MQRILIIGNAGSGKSTFAKQLAQKLQLPLVHLDKLFWQDNWKHISREEFDTKLHTELKKEHWIIDGNYNRTLPHRLQHCDTVFYFDLPTTVCLWGITKRVFENYGKTRLDMGGNCEERFDQQKLLLYRNVFAFNRQHRKKYYEMLKKADHATVIVFRSRKQISHFLQKI